MAYAQYIHFLGGIQIRITENFASQIPTLYPPSQALQGSPAAMWLYPACQHSLFERVAFETVSVGLQHYVTLNFIFDITCAKI